MKSHVVYVCEKYNFRIYELIYINIYIYTTSYITKKIMHSNVMGNQVQTNGHHYFKIQKYVIYNA